MGAQIYANTAIFAPSVKISCNERNMDCLDAGGFERFHDIRVVRPSEIK